jgi:cytochrome c-type biogenesis protein CcmH
MRRAVAALAFLAALAVAPAALASEEHPTLADLEDEVMCPVCNEPLEMSDSAVADRIRAFIRLRIDRGETKSEIKAQLVDEFGEGVLAAPPKKGFNLLAWLLPLAGLLAAAVAVSLGARRWRTARDPAPPGPGENGRGPIDPDLERRLDEELARYEG